MLSKILADLTSLACEFPGLQCNSTSIAQITYQDKATQTNLDNENTIEKILNAMTLFHTKLDTMEKELQQIKSQQHDAKHAELSPSDDSKIP
ncbi:hypothetical protein H5410_022373 [Solanum commersonii]|uniref:Uncharacterized protein n=1 Tax=Solanum commersonii TaxID=4109 RepID=A0A9J5ZHU4_SOLCO|nr:hypothetical protein H5410_022373 [Solanum commersonii]